MRDKLALLLLSVLLTFGGCNDDEIVLTKGEQNAQIVAKILDENPVRFVDIFEYDTNDGEWKLAADNQQFSEGETRFSIDGTFFVLDGTGSKTYITGSTPTRHLNGFYYFNLEFLVSFDLSPNRDELFMYFVY